MFKFLPAKINRFKTGESVINTLSKRCALCIWEELVLQFIRVFSVISAANQYLGPKLPDQMLGTIRQRGIWHTKAASAYRRSHRVPSAIG